MTASDMTPGIGQEIYEPEVATVFFDDRDIVRHPLVSKIVKAFDAES